MLYVCARLPLLGLGAAVAGCQSLGRESRMQLFKGFIKQ